MPQIFAGNREFILFSDHYGYRCAERHSKSSLKREYLHRDYGL